MFSIITHLHVKLAGCLDDTIASILSAEDITLYKSIWASTIFLYILFKYGIS